MEEGQVPHLCCMQTLQGEAFQFYACEREELVEIERCWVLSKYTARQCLADTKDILVFCVLAQRLYCIYLADTKDIY